MRRSPITSVALKRSPGFAMQDRNSTVPQSILTMGAGNSLVSLMIRNSPSRKCFRSASDIWVSPGWSESAREEAGGSSVAAKIKVAMVIARSRDFILFSAQHYLTEFHDSDARCETRNGGKRIHAAMGRRQTVDEFTGRTSEAPKARGEHSAIWSRGGRHPLRVAAIRSAGRSWGR